MLGSMLPARRRPPGPPARRAPEDALRPHASARVGPRARRCHVALVAAALVLSGTGSAAARLLPGGTTAVTPAGGAGVPGPATSWRSGPAAGVWPLRPEPEVLRGFAPPPAAWAAGHRGVDLAGRPGQQVRAARAGTVTFAGRIAGRGVVVVSHGDTRATYEPVAAAVSRGEAVAAGAVLGRLELLGSHCLPRACLHWGLVRGETYLDPLTLVGRGPVRLVPWDGLPALPWSPPGAGGFPRR